MDEKLAFNVVPRPLTAVMMASAMPAAIKPYSIAVAPDWSPKNFQKMFRKVRLREQVMHARRSVATSARR